VVEVGSQPRDRGPDIEVDLRRFDLLGVVAVREGVVTQFDSCRTAEVVDGYGEHADLGEPLSKLLVEAVQPSYVGHDHDPGTGTYHRVGVVSGELRAICGLEVDLTVVAHGSRRRGQRRPSMIVEGHGDSLAPR
jgi:hypothetical protein